jgi:hypothetical protein
MKKKNYALRMTLLMSMAFSFLCSHAENLDWVNAYKGKGTSASSQGAFGFQTLDGTGVDQDIFIAGFNSALTLQNATLLGSRKMTIPMICSCLHQDTNYI